jgi:hypothetical protein
MSMLGVDDMRMAMTLVVRPDLPSRRAGDRAEQADNGNRVKWAYGAAPRQALDPGPQQLKAAKDADGTEEHDGGEVFNLIDGAIVRGEVADRPRIHRQAKRDEHDSESGPGRRAGESHACLRIIAEGIGKLHPLGTCMELQNGV